MKTKGIPREILHLLGCALLILNGLAVFLPGMPYQLASGVTVSFSLANVLWMFAFPIFAFLLVEAFRNTQDFKRLAAGVLLFAVVFEIPFDLVQCWRAFDLSLNNQFFTLFLGLLALKILEEGWNPVWKVLGILALCAVSCVLRCEYGPCGILLVLLFWNTRMGRYAWLIQLAGMLVLAWLSLSLSLRGVSSMIVPERLPLGGGHVESQYLYVLSLIPISLCGRGGAIEHRKAVCFAYGLVPIAFLAIYLLRRGLLGA